jgi:hypothetical protein
MIEIVSKVVPHAYRNKYMRDGKYAKGKYKGKIHVNGGNGFVGIGGNTGSGGEEENPLG